jgi:hypothetical protein
MVESPQMLPHSISRTTSLVKNGNCEATIIYPGQGAAYAALAEQVAVAIEQRCGARPTAFADTSLIPTRSTPLPDSFRQRPLILLGNLNINRTFARHYANYYCPDDATYPGGDGYDLRSLINPYGTGSNVVVAGGSSLRGVERAVEKLIAQIDQHGKPGELMLPFILEIELEPGLARALAEWPDTPLNATLPSIEEGQRRAVGYNEGLIRHIGAYGLNYAWTGDRRYGEFAAECLKALNAMVTDSYGDWHYRAERVLRTLPWLCAGGFLDDAEILRTDQLLLGTALGTQDMWWRMRDGRPPLGHRHQGKGTFEFYLLARYLKDQAAPNEAVRQLCDRWLAECHAFLSALAEAAIDDQDDESTLNNLATLYWYALGQERYEFFESGHARLVAQRAIALHDNMGAGAGQGGYGEGLPGSMYLQQEATVHVAACAFYYQDGQFKWLLQNFPHLNISLRRGLFYFGPTFMHKYDTGDELAPEQPENLTGIQVLPVTSHQYALNTHPPERIEKMGHSVNAPETWLKAEGIGINTLPRERGFDKIVLRGDFSPDAPYLLLQGYQGGYRWQGHMHAANCIVRFGQGEHIFLIQNTSRHSHYHKNGLFISDGYNNTPIDPIAERLAIGDFSPVGLTATRLSRYHHTDWTRHIFWSKADQHFFVIIDAVQIQEKGAYTLTCAWRTPGYAALNGHTWRAVQGDHCFTLQSSGNGRLTSEEELDQGGANPYVLRQFQEGQFQAGDQVTFQNLFYVRPQDAPENLDLQRISSGQILVTRDGAPTTICAAGPDIEILSLTISAMNAWITPQEIALSGVTNLRLSQGSIASDRPVGLYLDLIAHRVEVRLDTPEIESAHLEITLNDLSTHLIIDDDSALDLPADICRRIAAEIQKILNSLQPEGKIEEAAPLSTEEIGTWRSEWSFDRWTPVLERVRDLTVKADPEPLDGFPDQLIDTIIPEMRETWQQWPAASNYEIRLTLPREMPIDHIRIVGDSKLDPTLRKYSLLPDGITAEVGSHSFAANPESGYLSLKRYRDMEDRMETREVRIGQPAKQIAVHVPAPPDRPLVLHEIEVYSSKSTLPPVQHLLTADLTGDGRLEVVMINTANELVVLRDDGTECWRQTLPGHATHVSCHDLDGEGCLSICVGISGGELRVLSADGTLRHSFQIAEQFRTLRDAHFGWFNKIHHIAIWNRDADGRAALVLGGYAILIFLNPDYQIIGHSWSDGPWVLNILVSPSDASIWARSGWCHGVCVYEGRTDMNPSGEIFPLGGINQPMFRGLRRVIPFVHGKTTTFEWMGDCILAAADSGIGVLSTASKDWLWKIEGGAPIMACIATNGEVITGAADSFIAAFAQADGKPLRRLRMGAPVTGLAYTQSGMLVVGTRAGIRALDAQWHEIGFYPADVRRLQSFGDNRVLAERAGGVIEQLVFEE